MCEAINDFEAEGMTAIILRPTAGTERKRRGYCVR